jgi:hypothetical protein
MVTTPVEAPEQAGLEPGVFFGEQRYLRLHVQELIPQRLGAGRTGRALFQLGELGLEVRVFAAELGDIFQGALVRGHLFRELLAFGGERVDLRAERFDLLFERGRLSGMFRRQ